MATPPRRLFLLLAIASTLAALRVSANSDTARCLEDADLPRIARVRSPSGASVYARVVREEGGVPTAVAPLSDASVALSEVFDRASEPRDAETPLWVIAADERSTRICSPVRLPQAAIDDESHVVIAAGLNYAAHAEEAGGGDVFLFPKPVEPSAPYAWVAPPAGVSLLDYEVELAYVLLSDIDPANLPSREVFLANTAFFVANDITDREAIIVRAGFGGPGSGFVEAKGQPNFLPSGPWLVRGTELFAALEACGADGLGIQLEVEREVEGGDGFAGRQSATTAAMLLDPLALLGRIGEQIATSGLRTDMPVERDGVTRYYPFAVVPSEGAAPILPAGSIVVTGTPEGVAMQAPSIPGLVWRGLLELRGPIEQFRQEQLARAALGEPGGYLAAGDRVRASIDGLGTQLFRVAEAGTPIPLDPCE